PPGDVEARIHCLRLGADECIPFDSAEEETLARIEALLRIKSIQDRMERSRRELQRLSTVDGLTGLSSRRHLQARCREELVRARRYRDPLSLILVDVDHFREVTGRLGEAAGDAVLCEVARRLRGVLREVDLAGRQGGDTFVVVLPSTHITGALAVAERIWKAIGERPFLVAGERLTVRVSLGLSFFPARGVSSHEDLFRLAQDALHRAKREGRGRICLFQAAHYFYQPLSPGGASGGGS
ncbi:MAG: diguanylate cyclase, partial [Deltaproteobacteria bacterium]